MALLLAGIEPLVWTEGLLLCKFSDGVDLDDMVKGMSWLRLKGERTRCFGEELRVKESIGSKGCRFCHYSIGSWSLHWRFQCNP